MRTKPIEASVLLVPIKPLGHENIDGLIAIPTLDWTGVGIL